MRILLVDDERLARQELKRLLASFTDISVEIVGEADNGDEALKQIATLAPEVVLMDIQMPGKSGLDVLAEMGSLPQPGPAVIFTTAYDEYALKAFEFSAADYLLKPVDPERLRKALTRLHLDEEDGEDGHDEDDDHESDSAIGLSPHRVLGPQDQVFIKDGEKCYFIKLEKIRLFESIGNYVRLHFDGGKPMILRSLNALEERLEPTSFFRVNRKHIVNLKMIEHVEPYFSGSLLLRLQGGDKIEVSRRQATRFKEVLSL